MPLIGFQFDNAREVDRNHRGDVSDAEGITGNEIMLRKLSVQRDKKLLATRNAAPNQLRNLRIIDRPW